MPSPSFRSLLYPFMTLIVTMIVLAAFVLSVAAVAENLRYLKANTKILSVVGLARSMASSQKNFAVNPGEDIWADLTAAGQVLSSDDRLNPWAGTIRAVSVADNGMRIETDLPARDCRRIAWYFLEQPVDLGVKAIEAQDASDMVWKPIYPAPANAHGHAVEMACPNAENARLALVFRLR